MIRKVTEGGSGTFGFTSTTLAPTTWDLTTTGSGAAHADARTFSGVRAGTYDASETVPPGWNLTSATCDDGSPVSAIDLAAGETVTCTFTNTAQATLIVAKETAPDHSSQEFKFTKTSGFEINGGTFDLTDGTNTGNTYANVTPGTYVVNEAVPAGWRSPPSIACTGDTGSSNLSSGSGTAATFDLQPGETVTCTYTNTQLAKVTVHKTDDANPANAVNGATFGVYEDLAPASTGTPGAEDLAAGTAVASCTVAAGTCATGNVLDPAKAYWVVETTTPAGYTTAAPQRITPTAGQNVEVTFVDQREFTVITIVCQNGKSPSLYKSGVTLDGVTKNSLASPPDGLETAQLCSLGGATFSPKHVGSHLGSVNIPQ